MVDLTNIKSIGIDVEAALAELDKDVNEIKNDEDHKLIFDCLAKGIREHDMEVYQLFKHSRYASNFIDRNALSTVAGISALIDAVGGMVYDILDDGEFHLIKVETVGSQHKYLRSQTKFERDTTETADWFVWNMYPQDTYAEIKKAFNTDYRFYSDERLSDLPVGKYDSLKITHCYVNIERFKKIFQLLDEHKVKREKYIEDFCKKVGMPRDKYSFSVDWKDEKLYELQHDAWSNEPELDLTGVTDDWHTCEIM